MPYSNIVDIQVKVRHDGFKRANVEDEVMPKTSGLESIAQRQSAWSLEIDLLRVKLSDGSIVDPKTLDLQEVFAGKYELWNVCRQTYDVAAIEELRDSIVAIGVQDEMKGYYVATLEGEQVVVLTDGHRRLFASLWARQQGHHIVRVPFKADKLQKGQTEAHYLLTQLKSNSATQVPLTMLEQGLVIKRFLAYGNTVEEVSIQTGIKRAHLENCLAVANSPSDVKQLIKDGTIAPTTVVNSINSDKTEFQEVIKEALDIAEVEARSNGKEKVKVTNTHVKQAREKRKNVEVSEAERQQILEDVQNADFAALSYSELIKINEIIRKHWSKR